MIAPSDKVGEPALFSALPSITAAVPSAVLAVVKLGSELGKAKTVTVAALAARLAIDVETSAGSGWPGVKTYSASYTNQPSQPSGFRICQEVKYPSDLDLCSERMFSIGIQSPHHAPACAAACKTTIEKGRPSAIDGQIPHWKLRSD